MSAKPRLQVLHAHLGRRPDAGEAIGDTPMPTNPFEAKAGPLGACRNGLSPERAHWLIVVCLLFLRASEP